MQIKLKLNLFLKRGETDGQCLKLDMHSPFLNMNPANERIHGTTQYDSQMEPRIYIAIVSEYIRI